MRTGIVPSYAGFVFWAQSDDEWRHSLKIMVNYEDDYLKHIVSKQNHLVSLFWKA